MSEAGAPTEEQAAPAAQEEVKQGLKAVGLITTSEDPKDLFDALIKAHAEIPVLELSGEVTVKKDGKVLYTYKYAPLSEIMKTIRPILAKAGLAIIQNTSTKTDGSVMVTTTLIHSTGQWATSAPMIIAGKESADIKDLGGKITYIRRYQINSMLALAADEDTDANGTSEEYNVEPLTEAVRLLSDAMRNCKHSRNLENWYHKHEDEVNKLPKEVAQRVKMHVGQLKETLLEDEAAAKAQEQIEDEDRDTGAPEGSQKGSGGPEQPPLDGTGGKDGSGDVEPF
ncbi:MAG: ERF family protein [Deltaproteobacteria bacterium]|nr:ERF family protein [Deltaproteobacteria bacterium]